MVYIKKRMERKKITIVGAGNVGSMTALYCFLKGLGDIVLWNRTAKTAKGIALDIATAGPLLQSDVSIIGTDDYKLTRNSDVIVITAGVQRQVGMSRDDLLNLNGKIIKDVTKKVTRYSKDAILIMVSNPLDAMVYLAKKLSGFPKNRVIGMAGTLDTSRYKSFIAEAAKISVKDVDALVLGSHGDSMIPLVGYTTVNGVPIENLMKKNKLAKIIKRTRDAGAEVLRLQGSSAFYSTGAAITEMIEAILKDEKRVLPCAAYLDGEYGVKGIFMGVPVKLGAKGVEKIIEVRLNNNEKKMFMKSAMHIKELISSMES